MKALEIHFKSGASLTVDATDLTSKRVADELTSLEWTTPNGAKRKLHGIYNIGEVVALVVVS